MTVEVIPTTNHHPTQSALDLLMTRINDHCNKPAGVTLQVDDEVKTNPPTGVRHLWSWDELVAFEQANARVQASSGTAVLHILYLDGGYGPNQQAIAISYTDHSVAIFTDMLGPGGPEGPALVHEFGHEMGLCGGTARMVTAHNDPHSALHDISPHCVMYYSLDPNADPQTPTDYCQHCKDDLAAAGGKVTDGTTVGTGEIGNVTSTTQAN